VLEETGRSFIGPRQSSEEVGRVVLWNEKTPTDRAKPRNARPASARKSMPTRAIQRRLAEQGGDRWGGSGTSCKPSGRSCCGRNPRRRQERPAPSGDDARGWGSGLRHSKPCCERAMRRRQMGHTRARPRASTSQRERWVRDFEGEFARCPLATTRYYFEIFPRV